MRLIAVSLAILISLFSGCKSVPEPTLPEAEAEAPPEELVFSEDEIEIINKVIDHVLTLITRELKNSRSDMQICINDEFYLHRVNAAAAYETDLKNAERFLQNEMSIDDEMVVSFIDRNAQRKNFDKDVKFKADFFWKGDPPQKNYFRLIFSSIGFNKDHTKAVIHVCIDLPGWMFTEYVYLEKTNENWAYVRSKLH
jgi:hypothetical protein